MSSLFLRIFLWFWLAMALVNVAFFLSFVLTRPEPPRSPPGQRPPGRSPLGIHARVAAEIFEREGAAALTAYLERLEEATNIRADLFNDRGEKLAGRELSAGAQKLVLRAAKDGPPEFATDGQVRLGAQKAMSLAGRSYTMVAELPPPPDDRPYWFLRMQLPRLIAALLIGGVLCYWLARHLTHNVIKLRATAQELAAGNLTARVSSEITKRRDELAYLGRDVNRMAERIQAMVDAQRRLLGDISHELRSPLTRLILALEIARLRAGAEEGGGAAAADAHDRIESEAAQLNEMISQLLALARMESSAETVARSAVDLSALVREVADDADFEARSRHRAVRIVSCQRCTMMGSADLLRSAVENVVRNAVRYTAEGTEVEIALACDKDGDREHALIRVRDHGPGVTEEALDDIFKPFYRVADDRDRQSGGTGLGLAITARAVRLHGGTITAKNDAQGGLIVELRLPTSGAMSDNL
ncbi:MAG: ATP-binding protein [Pyrinomonadaceae bacterium]